jgi:hypothetical protein
MLVICSGVYRSCLSSRVNCTQEQGITHEGLFCTLMLNFGHRLSIHLFDGKGPMFHTLDNLWIGDVRPIGCLKSKMVFLGLDWKALFFGSPTLLHPKWFEQL